MTLLLISHLIPAVMIIYSDLLIFTCSWVKPGAVVIDCGINSIPGELWFGITYDGLQYGYASHFMIFNFSIQILPKSQAND